MAAQNFHDHLESLLTQYPSYQPGAGFFQRARSVAHGHGRAGYDRKERLKNLLENETTDTLLPACARFYLRERLSSNASGSWLMTHLATLLKEQLGLNDNTLEKYSPKVASSAYLGACDGGLCVEQYDLAQGFINYLQSLVVQHYSQVQADTPKLQ